MFRGWEVVPVVDEREFRDRVVGVGDGNFACAKSRCGSHISDIDSGNMYDEKAEVADNNGFRLDK